MYEGNHQYFTQNHNQNADKIVFFKKVGRLVNDVIIDDLMNRVLEVEHQGLQMRFTVPNSLNRFRVETFHTKEPETLEWIDGLPEKCTLWDVGANIGLYSI